MTRRFWTAACLLVAWPAAAQDSWSVAAQIGGVIASERACGVQLDPGAIEAYIAARVDPDDLEFTSALGLHTRGVGREIENMSDSLRVAHCAQIRRVVEAYNLSAD
ncbi:MAG: signal recognition particle [Oricola sp.]|nr:MAG: signal recognition particle [Oricola sp.]